MSALFWRAVPVVSFGFLIAMIVLGRWDAVIAWFGGVAAYSLFILLGDRHG